MYTFGASDNPDIEIGGTCPTMSSYAIDQSNGSVTPLGNSPYVVCESLSASDLLSPVYDAIDPTGRFVYLYYWGGVNSQDLLGFVPGTGAQAI